MSISEFIDEIGFGPYQTHVLILAAGTLVNEGAITQMVSSLVDTWSDEVGEIQIGVSGRARPVTCVFLGVQLGTAASGLLADTLGRRWPIAISYTGTLVMGVVLSFLGNSRTLHPLLVGVGVFAGAGIPSAFSALSEVVPKRLRGATAAALGFALRLGWLWSSAGLLMWSPMLTGAPWRWLVLWATAPAGSLLALAWLSPASQVDTAHFWAGSGDHKEALRVLNIMADVNGRSDVAARLPASHVQGSTRLAGSLSFHGVAALLLRYPVWYHLLVLTIMFLAKEFVAAGSVALWPSAFSHMGHYLSPAGGMVMTTLLGFPGVLVAIGIMHRLQRRSALVIGAVTVSVSSLAILELERGSKTIGLAGVCAFQLFFPSWQMATMLLPSELFPTRIKTWCFSIAYFLARFGSELAPQTIEYSHALFFVTCSVFGLVASLLAHSLPETKDWAIGAGHSIDKNQDSFHQSAIGRASSSSGARYGAVSP